MPSPEPLSLGTLLAKYMPPAFQVALRLMKIKKEWDQVVSPQLAGKTKPVSFDRTGLVVECVSPAAAQLIAMSSRSILKAIEKRWGQAFPGIRTVVVRQLSRRVSRPQEPRGRAINPDAKTVTQYFEENAEKFSNKNVALALARLRATFEKRFGGNEQK